MCACMYVSVYFFSCKCAKLPRKITEGTEGKERAQTKRGLCQFCQ